MRLEDLMERAAKYDENLARDIKDYVHSRKYGLVYEASKPEFVRMWKKPVVRGDIVNILPPRGVMEDTKNEDDSSEIIYKVISISEGVATLRNEQTGEAVTASADDIVALARFDKPIYAGLKETGRVERGGDKPYHVVINGENYHALQTLVYAYQGQVDCIYIDPPYNSGAKDWKYNNNYVGKDDIYRHSKWLTFMEDRLKLAKKLLKPDNSVLLVTVDEKEYLRLGLLLEQMFPPSDNVRIQMISSVINSGGAARDMQFFRTDEYIYVVEFGSAAPIQMPLSQDWAVKADERTNKVSWRMSLLRGGSNATREHSPGCFYPIFVANDGSKVISVGKALPMGDDRSKCVVPEGCRAIWPIHPDWTEGCWQMSPEKLIDAINNGYVRLGRFTDYGMAISYLNRKEIEKVKSDGVTIIGRRPDNSIITDDSGFSRMFVPGTQWRIDSHNARIGGTNLLKTIIPGRSFPYPKSLYAVEDCLRFFVKDKPTAIIIDFFAGSGTTTHAVMRLNHQDGGKRRSISVTNNEVSEEEASRLISRSLRQGDSEWEKLGICEFITKPRIKSIVTGKTPDGKMIEGNYGVETEEYKEIEGEVTNPETGKKIRGKVYKKTKTQSKSVLDPFPISDGFEENAIFFDLEYLEPSVVSADLAFDRIAPILWLAGGCKGEILQRQKGYVIGETYAVLFDPRYTTRFVDAVSENKEIKTVFIVTDAAERYRSLCAELPGCRVMQLYESYLRSFEINAIG